MDGKEINKKVAATLKKIDKYTNLLYELRAMCQHKNVKKIARSSTGNYDPSNDCYWYECSCPDCGDRWSEDQ